MQKIVTFLMFQGNAEEAMAFYVSLFPGSEVGAVRRFDATAGESAGVMHASFTLAGQEFMCIDSTVKHDFSFTPAMSLYVRCEAAEEIDRLFRELSAGGSILMPIDEYPFSPRFGWVMDRFGISWQLDLARA